MRVRRQETVHAACWLLAAMLVGVTAAKLLPAGVTGDGGAPMSGQYDSRDFIEVDAADEEPEEGPPPESTGSEIVDASVILYLRIVNAHFDAWDQIPEEGVEVRHGTLRLNLLEIVKGQVRQRVGETFDLNIEQRGRGRITDYMGLWSHVPVILGTELLAYTHGANDDARVLLTDEYCHRLVEARGVLQDTRAAVLVEKRNMPPGELLTATTNHTERFGDTFARFLWSRVRDSVLTSQLMLDSYLRLVENPTTRPDARDVYLSGLYEDLGMISRPARETEIKLAQSMCRLLLADEAAALRPTIAGVYLPNLVRADAKKPKYSAAEILGPIGIDRDRVAKIAMSVVKEEERARKLVAWLAN